MNPTDAILFVALGMVLIPAFRVALDVMRWSK